MGSFLIYFLNPQPFLLPNVALWKGFPNVTPWPDLDTDRLYDLDLDSSVLRWLTDSTCQAGSGFRLSCSRRIFQISPTCPTLTCSQQWRHHASRIRHSTASTGCWHSSLGTDLTLLLTHLSLLFTTWAIQTWSQKVFLLYKCWQNNQES